MSEDFTRLPLGQAKFLLKLIDSKRKTTTADGRSEGGSAKELHRKGYARPFGVVGRRVRWQLIEGKLTKNDITLLRELIK